MMQQRLIPENDFCSQLKSLIIGETNHPLIIRSEALNGGYYLDPTCLIKSECYNNLSVSRILQDIFALNFRLKQLRILFLDPRSAWPFQVAPLITGIESFSRIIERRLNHISNSSFDLNEVVKELYKLSNWSLHTFEFLSEFISDPSEATAESTWKNLFDYSVFGLSFRLPLWTPIYHELIEILPSYLDEISTYDQIVAVSSSVLLTHTDGREVPLYFSGFWPERIFYKIESGFRMRECIWKEYSKDRISLKNWSQFFKFDIKLPELKIEDDKQEDQASEIHHFLVTEVGRSCDEWCKQFAQIIYDGLKKVPNLEERLNEVEAIFSVKPFITAIVELCQRESPIPVDEVEVFRSSLSTYRPLNISNGKIWRIRYNQETSLLSFHPKLRWPLNFVINAELLKALHNYSAVLHGLYHYNASLGTLQYYGFNTDPAAEALHFIATLRQTVEKLIKFLQSKLNNSMVTLRRKVLSASDWMAVSKAVTETAKSINDFFDKNTAFSEPFMNGVETLRRLLGEVNEIVGSYDGDAFEYLYSQRYAFDRVSTEWTNASQFADNPNDAAVRYIIPQRIFV